MFDELLELVEYRLVLIIIKDFIPLCLWANWPSQNLANACIEQGKECILIETLSTKALKGAVKLNIFIASEWSAMLQNHDLFGAFFISEHFLAKNASFVATGSRKTSAMKQQQLIPV